MTLRYIEKFENIAGTISYTFPLSAYEAQIEQAMRTPMSVGVGADYAHDHLGYGVAPKDVGRIRVRAFAKESTAANLEAEIDEARSECLRIGLGYLYRLDADGSTRRRCLARLASMPSIVRAVGQFVHMPIVFDFVQLSDWFATTATTGGENGITANSKSFTVTNAGNIPVKTGFSLTLTAVAVSGFGPTTIQNNTTAQVLYSTRVAELAGAVLVVGNPDYAVTYDDGRDSLTVGLAGRYVGQAVVGNHPGAANDYSVVNIVNGFFTLEPGNNSFVITIPGSPNYDYAYSFYGAFA